MITVAEAQARILAALSPLPAETIGLNEASARVLAEPVTARRTQPPFRASAMDGYAVRAADVVQLPARLRIIGESQAGTPPSRAVGPGEAMRIFTGAPVPEGADTVVLQENTLADELNPKGIVCILEATPRRHIRPEGGDFSIGDPGLSPGRRLGAREIALAAAMDWPWLSVHRRPRIAILPTGDEIVMPGEARGPAQIVSSNGLALAAFVRNLGCEALQLGIAGDNRASLRDLAAAAAGCDLLVTIGGVSVGEHDLVREVLTDSGLEIDFWKIAMRPGKPLMFGALGRIPVLGLPGNPVSALVTARLFLQPALECLQGIARKPSLETAFLATDLAANDHREEYLRATLRPNAQGRLEASPLANQDSSLLSVLAAADCLIIRPANAPAFRAGESVPILRLGEMPSGL